MKDSHLILLTKTETGDMWIKGVSRWHGGEGVQRSEWKKIYLNILLLESGKEGNELRTILRLR